MPFDSDEDPGSLREEVAADLLSLADTASTLMTHLESHLSATRQLAEAVSNGTPVLEVMHSINSDELRPAVTDALADFERARRHGRVGLIAVAISEGAGDSEIMASLNISNEMLRRHKREFAAGRRSGPE